MTTTIDSLRYVDLDTSPFFAYDEVEKFGDPFDSRVTELGGEGSSCEHCGGGVGQYTYDTFPDEGHRMAAGWNWATIVTNGKAVWLLCEPCSVGFAPRPTAW